MQIAYMKHILWFIKINFIKQIVFGLVIFNKIKMVAVNKIFEVEKYIADNPDKDLSINTLSKKYFIAYHYLCALFKEETGKNLKQFVIETRINRARELLHNKKVSCKEACYGSGFKTLTRFNRAFKIHFNETPSQYKFKLFNN
jgi:AraC-like DNA-binding protein